MSIFSNTILREVYEKLTADSALVSLVNDAVFDDVPQTQDYPFIAIGELVENEFNNDDPEQMNEASLTIHTFSRENGRKEVNEIQERITQLLHRASISASGFNFISIDHEQSQSFTDADGKTRHGVAEFKILISEA